LSIDNEEFNHVDGLDVVKDIWISLWMAHEGSNPVRKAKIDTLDGQLNRFIIFDDETPQDMFNRLKKLVNKAKALGSKKWTDRMLTERLMRAYIPMNYNVVALIRQDSTCKRMTSDDVLGRIMNHEMYIEEANHIKNLYKGITTTKKQEIALKANKKSKNKQVVVESSIAPNVMLKIWLSSLENSRSTWKRSSQRGTRSSTQNQQPREYATIVVSMVISLLIAPLSVGMMIMTRRRVSFTRRTRATRKVISLTRRNPMVKLTLVKNGNPMMRAPTLIVMMWQPWLSREHLIHANLSSQSSIKENTLALWQRRASVR
jgi:hypothetical protein